MSKISLKHSGGNVVSLNSPTSAPTSADVAFKLPNADGTSGQAIVTDGSGNLSFAGTGKILQVLQTTKTDRASASVTSGVFEDISGLSVSITPTATSSKILVSFHLHVATTVGNYTVMSRIMRGSTAIGIGDQVGSNRLRVSNVTWSNNESYQATTMDNAFLDSPNTTSATTYKIQWTDSYGQTIYLNRGITDGDAASYPCTSSHITVMEVVA